MLHHGIRIQNHVPLKLRVNVARVETPNVNALTAIMTLDFVGEVYIRGLRSPDLVYTLIDV